MAKMGGEWLAKSIHYCKRNIDIASMGEGALTSHAKGKLT